MSTGHPAEIDSMEDELKRLQRRVERERMARAAAEVIAERGLRELYEHNQDLDRLVQERVAESEQLAHRALLAERVKAEILGAVSHELRTPLMAVVGALDLMQSEALDRSAGDRSCACVEDQTEFLDAAIAGAARLRGLVDDLLMVADLGEEGSDLQRVPTELGVFVESLADTWRLPALKGGLLLVTTVGGGARTASFDVDGTRAALDRLIDNSIRYSSSGTVTIAAEATDGEVSFAVCDEGAGIDPEQLQGLLEPFEMADRSSTRSRGGMGLGLAVARGLIETQGGRVEIESELGVGTRIVATLPA